jgi:hypothetical protein
MWLMIATEPHIHQSPFIYAKEVCESADSEASIAVMKEWINRCHMTHQHAPPSHDFKPTRVIKLGKDEDDGTHLYPSETPVKFVALSYR